ncbi:MAG TPA: hypothetical protein ENH92_01475, partial [Ectothiorhodospiraceae bacterium]|nr:hypothetical protein [Ectothiorhodospiraceae bacterium]
PSSAPKMTVQEKKEHFKKLLLPAVTEAYNDLNRRYLEVAQELEQGGQNGRISQLKQEFKATSDQQLLAALKPHPISIALAQAAMESAWGTSRFFREANNVFGVWSFDPNEPRIAAGKKRGDKTIWVKRYKNVTASVLDYYRVIAKGNAFTAFRTLRLNSNDPFILLTKLDRYSERGDAYGKELAAMIRFNKFTNYDQRNL